MTTEVRLAEPADSERLARINIDAWRAAYTGLITPARLDSMRLDEYVERWQGTLTGGDAIKRIVMVAELDGIVAAYCTGGPYRQQEGTGREDTATWSEIYALYTDPAMQNKGAGTAAHDAMLDCFRRKAFQVAALWVLAANERAQRWYVDRGWRADGATADWMSHGLAHLEIRLRLSLRTANAVEAREPSRLGG